MTKPISKRAHSFSRSFHADFSQPIGLVDRRSQRTAHHEAEIHARLAQAWLFAAHAPSDPRVKLHYAMLNAEAWLQFSEAERFGIEFTIFDGPERAQPYQTLEALCHSIDDLGKIVVWPYGNFPSEHPMLAKSKKDSWRAIDIFRAVHDLAHGEGFGFDHTGEEGAYQFQTTMFSPASWPALATELRAPNAWLFYGEHNRRNNGSFPVEGDSDFTEWYDRPYPAQKATMLSSEFFAPDIGAQWPPVLE